MLITFTGPGSSGKNTLMNLCKQTFGDQFTYVDEVTRKIHNLGFPINEEGTNITQSLILSEHLQNACFLKNAILNRCIIDGLIYTKHLYDINHLVSKYELVDYAEFLYYELISRYDLIFYTSPVGVPLTNDGVRSTNTTMRDDITCRFELHFLHRLPNDKRVFFLTGTIEERFQVVSEKISQLILDDKKIPKE